MGIHNQALELALVQPKSNNMGDIQALKQFNHLTATEHALSDVAGIGQVDDDLYRVRILRRHPSFSRYMARVYQSIAKNDGFETLAGKQVPVAGYVRANRWLYKFEQDLKAGGTGLFCDCGDERIIEYAKAKARKTELHMKAAIRDLNIKIDAVGQDLASGMETAGQWAWRYLLAESERVGIDLHFKHSKNDTPEQIAAKKASAVARAWDAKWWLRKTRTLVRRQFEEMARTLGLVSKKRGGYISNFTFARRLSQAVRNESYLLELEAVNEDGYCATLKDMSDAGISNPENRYVDMVIRFKGFQGAADSMGYGALAVTLTTPSKYHAVLHTGRKNPKFKGATPRDGQEYLTGVWARIRADLARKNIQCFGFRVAEPHHDGTPHWHLGLYMRQDDIEAAKAVFTHYALEEDGSENGAIRRRVDFMEMDYKKDNLIAYFMKYISKNITGKTTDGKQSIGKDFETGGDCANTADRVTAWATCWGIRQFQSVGGPSVSVYRELRRLSEDQLKDQPELVQEIATAADAGDWETFCKLMGGVTCKRKEQVLGLLYRPAKDLNRYGEFFKVIRGVVMGSIYELITRIHDWVIQPVGTYAESLMIPQSGAPPTAV